MFFLTLRLLLGGFMTKHLFNWYNLFENKNIRFAKIKFSGVAQLYYESVKDYMEKMGEPLVTN